ARVDVAGLVDRQAARVGAVLLGGPQIAQVAEDDLAVVVVGVPGQLDWRGLRRRPGQQGEHGCEAQPEQGSRAQGASEHGTIPCEKGAKTSTLAKMIMGRGGGGKTKSVGFVERDARAVAVSQDHLVDW